MTALTKYQKLESHGLWRQNALAQRREVVVNLGDTSLVLTDPKQDHALAHWSLPAVRRMNPGEMPAVFTPGTGENEILELHDTEMIAALETVHSALESARPHPGRLRNSFLSVGLAAVLALGYFWLPDALITHTASVLPAATRAEIGRLTLADLTQITGQPCAARRGQQALSRLRDRLFGGGAAPRLIVVRDGIQGALDLPGGQIVLAESLLAEQDGPELAAGFALVQSLISEQQDPMIPLLRYAGFKASFQLLTTGVLPAEAVAGYAQSLIAKPKLTLTEAQLLPRFEAAGLPSTPYAYAIDPSGETVKELIEADPFLNVAAARLLQDEDWVGLQDICTI